MLKCFPRWFKHLCTSGYIIFSLLEPNHTIKLFNKVTANGLDLIKANYNIQRNCA